MKGGAAMGRMAELAAERDELNPAEPGEGDMDCPLAHALWCERDGDRDRWHWQTIAVIDDDREQVLDAGIEDTKEEAQTCVATSLRNHR